MRRLILALALPALAAQPQQPYTLQQILSAPYASSLTAAPVGTHFAWVENAEGRRNLWVAAPNEPAHQLTHNTEDDGQDISTPVWSPDGQLLAYTYGAETGASGHPANPAHLQHPTPLTIFIVPITGGDPIRVAEGHSPLFTHDGHSILFIRNGQVWIAPLPPAKPAPKTTPEQQSLLDSITALVASGPLPDLGKQLVVDRGSASQLTLSPEGKLLAYVSHRRSSDRTHTYIALYNLETHALTFPAPSTGNDSAPIFSPDGKQLAWLREPFTTADEFDTNRTSPTPWSIQLADLTTNNTRTVFSPEPNKPGSVLPRLSTGEPHLYWTAPITPSPELSSRPERSVVERPAASSSNILFFSEADGWVHLYSINASISKPPVLLTPGDYEVEDVVVAKGDRLVYFASNQKVGSRDDAADADVDHRHIGMLQLSPNGASGAVTWGNGIETRPQIAADGTIAALVSDAQAPMHPAVILRGGIIETLHVNTQPSTYPAAQLVSPQQVIFASSDNLFRLPSQLFLPKSSRLQAGKHPAIVFVHGGPKRQMLLGYPSMDYYSSDYAMNQYLASRGYIVLSVNYRGGIGYGLNFRQCEHCGADGAAEYNDVLAAAAYLRSRPDVDAAHIGIWGGSYGGYLTALALARNSDIFAAGVDFHGVHEWALEDNAPEDWLHGPESNRATIPPELTARAHASSPMADIAKWRSPILLIHGDDDPEVAYAQTPMLADALRAHNVHVEELIFPDEVHDFLLHKNWLAAYQAAADFFDRTLKPAPLSAEPK